RTALGLGFVWAGTARAPRDRARLPAPDGRDDRRLEPAAHPAAPKRAGPRARNRPLTRLHQNEQVLRTYNRATHAADQFRRVTHAAEWMLDNFYLIEEQIQMARRHLPRGYSRELPRLVTGVSDGLPRVYDIVLELISHVDAQIDAEPL